MWIYVSANCIRKLIFSELTSNTSQHGLWILVKLIEEPLHHQCGVEGLSPKGGGKVVSLPELKGKTSFDI